MKQQKRYTLWLLSLVLLLLTVFNATAQTKTKKPVKKTTTTKTQQTKTKAPATKTSTTKTTQPPRQVNAVEDEKRVRDIIAFFQYMLNTLGSNGTSARDKEVLVTESYSKIFRDGKVQIEDDLDEERIVITNKDIVPYLKDVDFFFRDVKFEFAIEDIKSSAMPSGELFYKVSTRRVLTGTTTDGNAVKTTIPRYIEVNYDPGARDLKIVSIYTHELNEKDALINWWNELSLEWKSVLQKKLPTPNTTDSLQIGDIKTIAATEDLDLRGNQVIQN